MPVRGKTAGNAGKGSKWIGKVRRRRIYARDLGQCVYCGAFEWSAVLTLDHIVPRSCGGTNDSSNLVTACMACNRHRGDKPIAIYLHENPAAALRVLRAMTTPLPMVVRSVNHRLGTITMEAGL